jgi:hypothetical protein
MIAAWLANAGEGHSTEKAAISLRDPDDGRLLTLSDGSLALIATDGRIAFRSPAGKWSEVVKLPFKYVYRSASDDSGVLVVGSRPATSPEVTAILSGIDPEDKMSPSFREHAHPEVAVILHLGVDGQISKTWEIPNAIVQSLATRNGRLWATKLRGMVELLPDGRVEERLDVPTVVRHEHGRETSTMPASLFLYLGQTGERVFCAPEECDHDGPCHYGYCYRRDELSWEQHGKWTEEPTICDGHLLEVERSADPKTYPKHDQNRVVVRRITNGSEVVAVKMEKRSVIACGGDDEFLIADKSIKAFQVTTGRRLWSVPVRSGSTVAVARAKDCVIALTNRGKQQNICREPIRSPKQSTSGQPEGDGHGRNP